MWEALVGPLTPERRLAVLAQLVSPVGDGLPVRLKACLIGEVEVLFRYTLSGL